MKSSYKIHIPSVEYAQSGTLKSLFWFFDYQITLKQSSAFLGFPSFFTCSHFVLSTKHLLNPADSGCIWIWFVTLLLAAAWHYTDTLFTVR